MSSPAIQFRLLDRDLFSPHTYYCVGFLRPIDSTGLKPFTNGLYVPVCGHLIVIPFYSCNGSITVSLTTVIGTNQRDFAPQNRRRCKNYGKL